MELKWREPDVDGLVKFLKVLQSTTPPVKRKVEVKKETAKQGSKDRRQS
jgi:hypothetical protein